ncbi:protein kinase family protein [Mycolicibacterium thermoresistibile]
MAATDDTTTSFGTTLPFGEHPADAPTHPLAVKDLADAYRAGYPARHPVQDPVPGSGVAGRYRLLIPHGATPHLQFWQALDVFTGNQVALTLVDPADVLAVEQVNEILARTVQLKGLDLPGLAPVREVHHTGRFGVVVADWVRGAALNEVAATGPAPAGVATAVQSLAGAAEAAHRAGLVLGVDDSARLRISVEGHAVLAFPATLPQNTPRTDLRGIGATLCALLTNCWPDGDSAPDFGGRVPYLLATTADGLLRPTGGIASAATLSTLLQQAAIDAADSPDQPATRRVLPPLPAPPPGAYAEFRNYGPAERAAAARRLMVRTCLGAAAAIVAAGVLLAASTVNGFLGDDTHTAGHDPHQLGLNATAPTAPSAPQQNRGAATPVEPVAATVFAPGGSPDNPDQAGAAIDGDPTTAWSTHRYYDAEPFPVFKPGVGLLLQLAEPTRLSAVTVDVSSVGTVVQIRSATGDAPAALTDTTELSPPTAIGAGANSIPVQGGEPVSHVLVWISTLGSTDGQSRSAISEIGLVGAPPRA